MNSKHTPGPWRTLLYGSVDDANTATRIDVTDSSRMQHNEPHYCTPVAVCRRVSSEGNFSFNPPNAEANARLIAAAPELLEACNKAIPILVGILRAKGVDWVGGATAQKSINMMVDAIAKAEGKL